MNGYQRFMVRQTMSETGMARLLELEHTHKGKGKGVPVMKFAALAACAALIIGVWSYVVPAGGPGPAAEATPSPAVVSAAPVPGASADDQAAADFHGFTAVGPGEEAKLMFPMICAVDYADVTDGPEVAASLALPEGSFLVELTKEDVQRLFWGPEGKPPVESPKTDPGDFPLMLMNWAGYTVTGGATYDGNGDLWELYVQGVKGEDSFTLRAAPGRIPPTCVVEGGAAVTDAGGVSVSGWYRSYDRDGDGVIEHICTSEFLANGVGFRFENVGSGGLKAGTDEADALGGAKVFNAMVVTQLCHTDGFYLDQFARSEDIPAWAEEDFETLAQARSCGEYLRFAPYLPAEGPEGYGEFHGRHSYQEGERDVLWVRWSRGCDDVEVEVYLPEGDSLTGDGRFAPVNVSVPASYDWRLYGGPISECVPEAYQMNFYKPTFRAEDMSLSVIEARGREKDTGGMAYRFYVLHENGAVVGYDCSGVSAQYVWSLVEATL